MIKKIISGGQTGVDRAGLDAAITLNIPHGGWCPKNRKAEDGIIPERFNLQECSSGSYIVRTEKNVKTSDATLILYFDKATGGTLRTIEFAKKHKKLFLEVNLAESAEINLVKITAWLKQFDRCKIILNIAGSRESTNRGIYEICKKLLETCFSENTINLS